mmetsp:Transcript_29545/g.94763  ORF Transcript_29545/g.94763 Transcript_29545/m.94763 type:complete len:300 (+) Transcript_29545:1271-2170(+)
MARGEQPAPKRARAASRKVTIVEEEEEDELVITGAPDGGGGGPSGGNDDPDDGDEGDEENDWKSYEELSQFYVGNASSQDTSAFTASKEEIDGLVSECMRFMLFSHYKEGGKPVNREKFTKLVTEAYRKSGQKATGLPQHVIGQAQAKFVELFGMEMKELDRVSKAEADKKKKVKTANQAAAKVYVLRSLLPKRTRRKFVDRKEDQTEKGLAMVVCSVVSLADRGRMFEAALLEYLKQMGVDGGKEGPDHPIFGRVGEKLNKFVSLRYLNKYKEGEDFVYELAENAPSAAGMKAFVGEP